MADETKKKTASKKPLKKYTLLWDVVIDDKLVKKGTKVPLTEKGAAFFKSKNYIE